ncbi:MAG: PAS domain S-box protein [Gallionella sp.]
MKILSRKVAHDALPVESFFSKSPALIFFFIALTVFAAEAAVMVLLNFLPPLSWRDEVFIDALLLVLLITPALYFFLFQPMVAHIGERVKIEAVLHKNENEQVKVMLRASQDGFWISDLRGRILEVNDAYCQMIGYRREDLLKMYIRDVEEAESPEEITRHIGKLLETGSDHFETRHRHQDGRILDIEVSVNYSHFQGGQFYCFLRNVTARKQVEKELKLSAQLLNSTSDSIFLLDFEGKFVYLNEAAWKSRGYTRDEMMAMNLRDLNAPEFNEFIATRMQDLLKNGVAFFESAHRCRDGTIMPVEINARVTESGGRTLLLSVIRNISERKQIEVTLRTSAYRLHELFENMSSGGVVYQVSADGKDFIITSFNKAAERIDHLRREDVLGKNVVEIFPSIIEFGLLDVFQRVSQSGVAEHFPISFYHDGHISGWRENYIYRLPSGEIVAIYDDVTQVKQAEKDKDEMRRNMQALLNAIQETTFLMEKDGTVVVINEIGARRLNTQPEALAGTNLFERFPPQVAESRRAKFEEIVRKGKSEIFEDERAGHRFSNAVYPIVDTQGDVQRFAVYAADITQQHRRKMIDDILSEINQQILQGVPLLDVLTSICQQIAQAFQLEVVWLGRKEASGAINVVAAAGSATHYIEHFKIKGIRWDDTPQGQGPAGNAIRTGQPQVFKVDDPRFQAWLKIAQQSNLQAIFAIPLVMRNEIDGVFTLYSSNPVLFESAELVSQLTSVAQRICTTLEAAMDQQQIRLLSSALESAGNGVLITDAQGRIQWSNPAFSTLCGYSKTELWGQTPRMLNSGQQSLEYYQVLWATIRRGEIWSNETVERAKDGTLYTVSQTITPIINDGELTHFIAIHEDITDQKLTQARIAHMAHYDALTGLPNRALYFDRLKQALSIAQRHDRGLAVLYMDLDGFKKINDTQGHHAGDLLLIAVADRISQCVRKSDTVARMGGDEFTIILNEACQHEDVTIVAKKIIAAISTPFELAGQPAHIGISIGIARYTDDANTEDELMQRADKAMYQAKAAGKNTYRVSE